MLPISRSEAVHLIDAFLVHQVNGLAVQADEGAEGADGGHETGRGLKCKKS